jgi:hypothetical protein
LFGNNRPVSHALDDYLPEYDVRKRHETVVDLPPAPALARLLAIPAAPDPIVRALLALRGLRAGNLSLPEYAVRRIGLRELHRSARLAVYGTPDGRRLAIVVSFWAEPDGEERSRLGTETRVAAPDRSARFAFRLYWLVVGPFSALIRRRWLRAASA